MDARQRIESTLERAMRRASVDTAPPLIASAMHYALFPGGARVRPRLCLAVAGACGDAHPAASNGVAAALELLHCASLVHDDLPCFDDAATRRGRLSLHRLHGQPIALLAGDALIVSAFETVALEATDAPLLIGPLVALLAQAVGMPGGIVAGQAWESEPAIRLDQYHRAKTGSLFVCAAVAGAVSSGADPQPWRAVGEKLGAAYQVADDLRDAAADSGELGKPVGQDLLHGRPSAVSELGLHAAVSRLRGLVEEAVAAVPDCPRAHTLQALILDEAKRLMPKKLAQQAA